jgi:hypothetical protein
MEKRTKWEIWMLSSVLIFTILLIVCTAGYVKDDNFMVAGREMNWLIYTFLVSCINVFASIGIGVTRKYSTI